MRTFPFPAALLPPVLFAIPFAPAAADAVTELDPVVVTATRTAEPVERTLAPVTVITRAEIEREQALDLADVLRGEPGVVITNSGGRGRVTELYLRGTNPNQTLFLVDGIRVGSATTGQTEFNNLPVSQIDRVEVVRGPRSGLYGSEAVGGVVQVFTRRGGGPLRPFFSTTAGGFGSAGVSGGLAGGGEHGRFSVSGGFEQTDGINACAGRGAPYFDGCGTDEPDRDGYDNASVSASAGYDLGERVGIDVNFMRAEADVDFDGAFQNQANNLQQVLGARVRVTPLTRWQTALSVGRSWDEQRNALDGVAVSRFDTRRDSLAWQNDITVADGHLVTLGLDWVRDEVGSSVDYAVDARDNTGIYGEYQGRLGAFSLNGSLRQDDNEQFGDHATGSLAAGYAVAPWLRLTASYGTAFTAPTFNDLYYPADPFFAGGNPDLKPEQSRSAELGAGGDLAGWGWSVNLYQTDIDDLIALLPPSYAAENIDQARIRGLEATASGRLFGTDLVANLTLLDPRNTSDGPDDGNLLARRPQQTFRLDGDRRIGRFGVGATVTGAGRSFDDPANSIPLDGYTLVDLRASFFFTDALRLQASIDNLLDADYETVAFYNQPGQALYVTLRYEP